MKEFIYNLWDITTELSPWLLFGGLIAGLLHVFMPAGFVRKHLGKGGLWSIVKAVAIGVPMPLCSCGVIPTAIGLKKDGASDGPSIGFLISTPQTGVDSIFVAAGFLGWPFAIFKVISAFITGLIGGLIVDVMEKGQKVQPDQSKTEPCCSTGQTEQPKSSCCSSPSPTKTSSCCSEKVNYKAESSCCSTKAPQTAEKASCCSDSSKEKTESCCSDESDSADATKADFYSKLKEIFSFAIKLLNDIYIWLIIGIVLAAIISTALPEGKLAEFGWATGMTGMLLILMASLPMYICATSSVPLAASLVAAGMPAGSALVLLMAGPATNIATIGAITGAFGKKVTAVYVITVAVMSVLLGLGFEKVIQTGAASEHVHGETMPYMVSFAATIVLIVLLTWFAIKDINKRLSK